jgi:putative membrane protein
MVNNSNPENSDISMDVRTKLSYERTYLAYERTQMSWVRTALSLISFGFSIAKFFEHLHATQGSQAVQTAPRVVGLLMIGIGLLSLMVTNFQHKRVMKAMIKQCPDLPKSLSGLMSWLIVIVGILAFFGAVMKFK